MSRVGSRVALGASLGTLALAGCGVARARARRPRSGNAIVIAGPTVPPPAAAADAAMSICPDVGVIEGGAALQAYSGGRVGEASALRSQITLGQLARECNGQAGRVDAREGRRRGPRAARRRAGGAGRFDVPVRFVVKSG